MLWFVFSIILFVIALGWILFAPGRRPGRNGAGQQVTLASTKPLAAAPIFLGVVTLLLSMFATVGTRSVGVPTVFGKPTGDTYGAGLQFKAPWVKVTDIDGSVQPEEYKGEDCIYVKLADSGSACISLSYRWRINPEAADVAFADYNKTENEDGINGAIRSAIVTTNVKAGTNEVFGSYDPLGGVDINPNDSPEDLANVKIQPVDLADFNVKLQENIEEKIANTGGLVNIESVTISYIKFSETTQDRINAFNAGVQDTKIALQQVATKAAQAEGNETLAKSLQDPNVLVSQCLDGLVSGDITNQPGFSCWPGGGNGEVVFPAGSAN